MASLTQQKMDQDGITPTYDNAAGGGDTVVPGAGSFIHVKNGDASPTTVTLVTPGTVAGLAVADQPVVIAAGAEAMVPVSSLYRDPATGRASITYSSVTSLTIASLRAPVAA